MLDMTALLNPAGNHIPPGSYRSPLALIPDGNAPVHIFRKLWPQTPATGAIALAHVQTIIRNMPMMVTSAVSSMTRRNMTLPPFILRSYSSFVLFSRNVRQIEQNMINRVNCGDLDARFDIPAHKGSKMSQSGKPPCWSGTPIMR
jgi:hypothetical protein